VTPHAGWGWRSLVAFVVGGLLAGSGFAVAQLDRDDDAVVEASAIEPASIPATTVPSRAPDPVAPAPLDPSAEAAAFVADTLGPSVVQVETDIGVGSGVVFDDGVIITNHHVVEGASRIRVQLKDGRRLAAEILGSEANVDIAVVSVGEGIDLPVAPLATGEVLRVGQVAIAIGSPFQLQQTVTEGIVSAVNRPVPTGNVYTAMIQTDAPINPGNSGGALADRQGRVIGINTAIQTDGSSNVNAGIGFAIPIDTAVSVADRIVAGIPIQAGFLGVAGGQSIDGAAGVQITSITEGSAADEAGLMIGDLILSIDGAPVTAFEELAGLVVARAPGETIELQVVRNGEPLIIEVTLGARED
jgi:S1-C subfamily serine protease